MAAQTTEVTDQIAGGRPWPGDGERRPRRPSPVRPPGRWWRPAPRVALLGLLALLLGYAVSHRPAPDAARADRKPAASPGPAQPPAEPWLAGHRAAGPAGLRLLVAGANPRVVDAATGAATPPPGVRLVPDTGVAAFPVGRSGIAVVEYAWAAGSYLLLPGADPQILGRQVTVSRGRDGGLIVVSAARGRTTVLGVGADARERWAWISPDGLTVLGDTPFGLVLQRSGRTADDRDLVLVDRRSGTARRVLGHAASAVAAGDHAVAWMPADCVNPCPLRVGDLRTGDRRGYPMPDGWSPRSGAFAPDGRRVALTFVPRGGQGRTGRVGVLDLRTGAVAMVPDLGTAPDLGAHLTWSPDGRWLVIGVPWPDHQAIALWSPGQPVRVLPTELPGRPGAVTVLP